MKHFLFRLVLIAVAMPAAAHAAWYWPFGHDEDDKDTPPRLHRLLENANDLIEMAEDAALEGDGEKALEFYNSALTNLADVAAKNYERAQTPEFAPLRNKIAATSAAIDSIRFAQVNNNMRAVSVTDTTELQRKYEKEMEKKRAKKDPPKSEKGKAPAAVNKPSVAPKPVAAKKNQSASATLEPSLEGFDEKIRIAIKDIRAKDYAAADLLLEDLEKERKGDLNVLILRSAAQCGMKYYLAARRTLEKAMRAHPKSYLPYYNLAHLMFKLEDEGRKSAREYYELGRALGGPVDPRLEAKLK